jgi:predicted RNA methylase
MTKLEQLKSITDAFLKQKISHDEVLDATYAYKTFLAELTNMDLDYASLEENLHFDNGMAIGTTWAARCVDDEERTLKFIKGVFRAVIDLVTQKERIHIMYAGTGPFATLVLPLLPHFSPDEIQFTLLEVNPTSLDKVQHLFKQLDCDDYVYAYELADATKYMVDQNNPVDLLISETMNLGLIEEQQVPIVMNLLEQLPSDVVMIPQKISLELAYYKMYNGEITYQLLGHLFELSKEAVKYYDFEKKEDFIRFTKQEMNLPIKNRTRYRDLSIFTDIQVYKDVSLEFNKSGLTVPLELISTRALKHHTSIYIGYRIDNSPHFEFELI